MNRYEFIRQLEMLLSDVTPGERSEALQFYNDYFDDAGAENEQEVIKALGSPAKVAATIKADLSGNATGEFTETGYKDFYNKNQEVVSYGQNTEQNNFNQGNPYQNGTYQNNTDADNAYGGKRKKEMSGGTIALIVFLCIFAAPFLIPIAGAALVLFLAFLICLAAAFIAVGAVTFALVVTGIVLIAVGIAKMFILPFGGMCLAGGGLVCLGIGILFAILTVWICVEAIPAVFRGVVGLCRRPFNRKRGAAV